MWVCPISTTNNNKPHTHTQKPWLSIRNHSLIKSQCWCKLFETQIFLKFYLKILTQRDLLDILRTGCLSSKQNKRSSPIIIAVSQCFDFNLSIHFFWKHTLSVERSISSSLPELPTNKLKSSISYSGNIQLPFSSLSIPIPL